MYIKRVIKRNKGSGKVYEYLHLVENVRTEKGPRQRLVLNLGALDVPEERFKELADCIERLLTGRPGLFPFDPAIEARARDAVARIREKRSAEAPRKAAPADTRRFDPVDVSSIETAEVRSVGPEHVCHKFWESLQINEVLSAEGVPRRQLPLLETLVVGRLVCPGSERRTREWAFGRSAIFELAGRPLRDSLNSFYRASDALFRCKDALEPHLARRERSLFDLSETLCLFDLTNTFLEGRAAGNPKARFGRSKEKRSDCRLLTLGLSVDEDGFPKYSRLFSGNQSEPETLAGMVEHMAENGGRRLDRPTVVVDAGIATKANLTALREAGFHYMAVERSRSGFSPDDLGRMRVVVRDEAADFTLEAVREEAYGEVRLLCRSSRRMKKEEGIRRTQENRFLEALTALRDGLSRKGTTKKYVKVAERVGRIRRKHPRASKWYEVTVVPKDASRPETTVAVDVRWEKNARATDDAALEGCYVVRSDRADLGDEELWKTWTMLSRVERAFRTLKSDLGLRPNFHQLEGRADAHMFISVLAYHILNAVEHRLREQGDQRSWATIRDVLSTHQRMTVEFDGMDEKERTRRHHLRLCSRPEPEHREIYDRLGLSHEPLPKKHLTAK